MLAKKALVAALAATSLSAIAIPASAQSVSPTTPERLLNALEEPQNWLMNNQTYAAHRNSALSQINRNSVSGLHVAFMASIGGMSTSELPGVSGNEQAPPLVEDGFMYVLDSFDTIMRFDVRSGTRAFPLWRHDPASQNPGIRGLALFRDSVYQSTGDARLIAIDKESGEIVFDVTGVESEPFVPGLEVAPDRKFVSGPVLYRTAGGRDIILQGSGGHGIGWFGAFDAATGENIWRTPTIPLPGDPNFGTWPGDTWQTGRVMPWHHPTVDPETNQVIWGTGEPSPVYDPEFRPGDNLYSIATVALDADTGNINWYFQEVPNDQWDHDSIGTRMIIDLPMADGTVRRTSTNWARAGFTYTLDLQTGEFIQAIQQLDNLNWTAGLDPKTGKPVEYSGTQALQTYAVAGPRWGRSEAEAPLVCSTWGGAPTFWPPSYDETTHITYQTRTTGCTYQTMVRQTQGNFDWLAGENLGSSVRQVQVGTMASLIAMDLSAGEVVNRYVRDLGIPGDRQAQVGTLLLGDGGLVFTGFRDGTFSAFDKSSLTELWTFNIGTDLKSPPITYAVGSKQYVAIVAGGDNNTGGSGIERLVLPTAMLVVFGL